MHDHKQQVTTRFTTKCRGVVRTREAQEKRLRVSHGQRRASRAGNLSRITRKEWKRRHHEIHAGFWFVSAGSHGMKALSLITTRFVAHLGSGNLRLHHLHLPPFPFPPFPSHPLRLGLGPREFSRHGALMEGGFGSVHTARNICECGAEGLPGLLSALQACLSGASQILSLRCSPCQMPYVGQQQGLSKCSLASSQVISRVHAALQGRILPPSDREHAIAAMASRHSLATQCRGIYAE
ncbi:hypothetical protein B0I35DRAFT_125332 [Stachybotrys elegans]|uniref:Uncharacterized protein n=1 Tax=Stachybotrys elegans TaxID=80388 RepID=A0A8K0WUV7_9HYPO|nr:hypothetical protein B0I35DRAFT_125332 [Stachybotrys elegans]